MNKIAFNRLLSTAAILFALPTLGISAAPTDWPEFRGPWANGHVAAPGDREPIGIPLRWSETENVKWKTEIPNQGWSSPVIMNGQIWLTAATHNGNDFFAICVDAESGKILFNEMIFHVDEPEPLGNSVNSYASPTPALEDGRVYIHFGVYGTACIDAETFAVVWKRSDMPCRHYRGPGSSPVVFEDLLILSFDGVDIQYLTALNKATGMTVWKTDRTTVWSDLDAQGMPKRDGDARKAFGTPMIVELDGEPLMVSLGASTGYGYDPRTGGEVWKIRYGSHTPSVRPIYGNGLAFFTTGYAKGRLLAVRIDGQGDVTDTHVQWIFDEPIVPKAPSPLLVDDLLYMVSDKGAVTCLEASSGKIVWSEGVGGTYYASPIYADGRIYIFSAQQKALAIKAGRSFEILATNQLDDGFMASPAVVGKALILRTKTSLYRIESGLR